MSNTPLSSRKATFNRHSCKSLPTSSKSFRVFAVLAFTRRSIWVGNITGKWIWKRYIETSETMWYRSSYDLPKSTVPKRYRFVSLVDRSGTGLSWYDLVYDIPNISYYFIKMRYNMVDRTNELWLLEHKTLRRMSVPAVHAVLGGIK